MQSCAKERDRVCRGFSQPLLHVPLWSSHWSMIDLSKQIFVMRQNPNQVKVQSWIHNFLQESLHVHKSILIARDNKIRYCNIYQSPQRYITIYFIPPYSGYLGFIFFLSIHGSLFCPFLSSCSFFSYMNVKIPYDTQISYLTLVDVLQCSMR